MKQFSIKAATTVAVLGGMIAGAISASAALNLPTQSCSYAFNTNMRLGSKGVDVMNLQKVLNAYPQTQVAAAGNAGSPGMETSTFGPATRAAVNKFQALHLVELGITAPTGNVFAGTRGLLNMACNGGMSTLPAGCTSTSGFSPITGQSCGTSVPTTPGTVSGPVSAMLAASQPTGMIVASQSGARLADIVFTGNGTVTSVELQRIGISADSALTNVYLYDGNTRISDAASVVTGGYIRFNASTGLFSVNGSRTITVRADIASGTSGNSIGVKLNSVTVMGGSPSTFTNVMGNVLQVGSATVASVNFAAMVTTARTVDAGTVNYNVWQGSATVSTRDVNLKAMTFKFVGSAPVDAAQNLSLYVDGTKVAGPATVNASNNNKLTFDLGSAPFLLKTGTHTIDVRGDLVKGSARTMTFSVENVADIMMEDTSLSGVNVAATVASAALTQSNSAFGTITVNTGSVTVNVDPTFNTTKVTGGATNVPVGQFTLKAYGEDVKVNSLLVTFATTTISTLNNVSLYANGAQVGTSQNFTVAAATAGGLTYTLGSSLIIPAGQTVTLTVKADVVDTNNAAYSAGTVAAKIGGVASNAQGQSSNEIVTVASSVVTGNTLTISSGAATFARTSGFTTVTVAPNTPNVKIGSFTVQAGSAEDIKVNSFTVNPVVSGSPYLITNLSNLRVQNGSTVLGTPVGNPASGTTTFSFNDVVVSANGTKTFDVYADVGGATSGSVTAQAAITYRGAISNTTTITASAGVAISSAASTLAASVKTSDSAVAQFVVGGSTFGIAKFKLSTATAGTVATVRELRFVTTGTDAIESITVGGVTAPVIGSGAGATTTVSGLNIAIGSTGTEVPVTVKFSGFQNSTSGGSLAASISSVLVTLGHVEATSGTGSVITETTPVNSNTMILVGSKPTVTVSTGGTDTLNIGALSKIGEFTITADANGKIAVASTSITISTVGITGPELATSTLVLRDGGVAVSNVNYSHYYSSTTPVISFTTPYEIGAGQSKTFSLYGTINGTAQSAIVPRANTSLTSGATFKWIDVIGGNSVQTGAAIYNFPSNSYTTKVN